MKKLTDYIVTINNIINKKICEDIINSCSLKDFEIAESQSTDPRYRLCYIRRLNKTFESTFFEAVGKCLKTYSDLHPYFSTGLTCEDTGYEQLLYLGSDKGEYKEHVDHLDLFPRVLSCSFVLNDNYEGGEFSFFNGEYIISPQQGTVIIFPSNFIFPHAVKPVSNGDRHAVITWIR
mgnify:CR=1 FL=1